MATSKSKDIKDALVTLLDSLELDNEPAFAQVKGVPRGEFDGLPAAVVIPARPNTEKASFGQNDRKPTYVVRLLVEATDDGTEFDSMYVLTDLVLDALESKDADAAFRTLLGAWLMEVTPGDWIDVDTASGPALMCDIEVEVSYSRNN